MFIQNEMVAYELFIWFEKEDTNFRFGPWYSLDSEEVRGVWGSLKLQLLLLETPLIIWMS